MILDAHKGEMYFACFAAHGGVLRRVTEDTVVTPQAAAILLPKPCTVIGDAFERYAEYLAADQICWLPFPQFGPSGGIVAQLGARQFTGRGEQPSASLEPFYIRPPEVQVSS